VIDKKKIEKIISGQIEGSDIFVVDLQIKPGNRIHVYLDHPDGINIETCVAYSRLIESNLDRETDDFELQVSSPGLDQPFKVIEQYKKNLGHSVKIITTRGEKFKGKITAVDENGIDMDAEVKVANPEGKKKKTELQSKRLDFNEIKSAVVNLEF
jgi:ribosome maturation factor RimP